MAGYMTKQQGYLYEGELVNGAASAVENGFLMIPGTTTNARKLVFPAAADTTTKFVVQEVTDLYGIPAVRVRVEKLNANYYLIENGFDINNSTVFDNRTYATEVGKYLRAHPLVVGEEFITTAYVGTVNVGTALGVNIAGKLSA